MKIQPIDDCSSDEPNRIQVYRPVVKSRLKRLFERPFQKISATEKLSIAVTPSFHKDGANNFSDGGEPSSVCLAKMVQNFMEENDKQSSSAARCSRNRCHCFNGKSDHSSEDESDNWNGESYEILKKLAPCPSVEEKNLLADMSRIVDKNKNCRRKDDLCRNSVSAGLTALGYDAAVCKSHWDKCISHIAGEYEYIDVIISGERLLVDIDFRSEFEIARSTKAYKSFLLTLPYIFVGKADRLQKIVAVVSDAAKRSLKKKGMHIPPWRKFEYVKAKWLATYTRTPAVTPLLDSNSTLEQKDPTAGDEKPMIQSGWKPPAVEPKPSLVEVRVLAGLASAVEGS